MKILGDENIPLVKPFFSDFGEVSLMPGREMTSDSVKDYDILLVRSVTKVNQKLLEGSKVRFVGTATTGVDHIDLNYLQRAEIGFADAAGSNTNSVAEYVLSALVLLGERNPISLSEKTAGIMGYGRIGKRVRIYLEALGLDCRVYDPWLEKQGATGLCGLEEVLAADLITLHPSLTEQKPYPSFHLVGDGELRQMKDGAIIINTSRGPVVDNDSLLKRLKHKNLIAVLDVWENEPSISMDLLDRVAVGTPHIAGYSLDGKLKGTEMIYESACRYFNLSSHRHVMDVAPDDPITCLSLDPTMSPEQAICTAVRGCYDVFRDDSALRLTRRLKEEERGRAFDGLRKNYPERREFFHTTIDFQGKPHPSRKILKHLGFKLPCDP